MTSAVSFKTKHGRNAKRFYAESDQTPQGRRWTLFDQPADDSGNRAPIGAGWVGYRSFAEVLDAADQEGK